MLHHFRPGENEEKWSQDALDLFKQLDVTGDGLVEWSEFADFILCDLGVPLCRVTPSTCVHLTMTWVVSFSTLRPFERPRRSAQASRTNIPAVSSRKTTVTKIYFI